MTMSSTCPASTGTRPSRHQGAVPPYLLERLAGLRERRARALSGEGAANGFAADTRGIESVAELARRTLLEDARLRERRRGRPLADQRDLRAVPGTLHREISDAESTEELPGRLVRKEGQDPVADPDVNRAYDGLGETYRFLEQVLHRSSVDGAGLALEGTVHYGMGYDNAFWDGSRMVFGDGDGTVFSSFTGSLSIIAHELGHGLLQHTTDLAYEGQSGALNESFADVFGVLVDQFARGDTVETATWIVGHGIFLPGIKGVGVRSLKAPGTAYDDPALGTDPQPAHMDGYVRTREDNGGVHLNSGIPNRAFYLAAEALGGHAWKRAGRVWFEAIAAGRLPVDVDFRGFARETVRVARALFGRESAEEKAVRAGWHGVGITVRLTENGPRAPRKGAAPGRQEGS